jgi:hypothetical protein
MYITQPTITPADTIVKAYIDLFHAIKNIPNTKGIVHLEALQQMETIHSPPSVSKMPMLPTYKRTAIMRPRVETEPPRVDPLHRTRVEPAARDEAHHPRVAFEPTVDLVEYDPHLEAPLIVTSKPRIQATKTSAPSPSKSIADRVKRHHSESRQTTEPESIAERVARRHREAANPVLDKETGQLLQYRQLLKHPKFKEAWNLSAANECGRLAQGVGNRIKGTDTIFFIHKWEIPPNR